MTIYHTYIDDNVGLGSSTIVGIQTNGSTYGVGISSNGYFSGIVTASSFVGDGSRLTGIVNTGSGIVIRDDGTIVGTAATVNFGANLSVSPISAGIVTVTGSGGNVTVTQTGYSCDNPITVIGGNTITIGSTSNAYGRKFVQTTTPTSPCDGDIWYDTSGGTTGDNSPAGTVIYHAASGAPTGYLKANGASLSTTTYATLFAAIGYTFGGSGASFSVPDLRGQFIRSWADDGTTYDAGRTFGLTQADDFKSHQHAGAIPAGSRWFQNYSSYSPGWPSEQTPGAFNDRLTGATGGTETRPRNIALLACIKY